jgi:Icc-related predicted phosphoesterase
MTTLFFATDIHGSDICWKKFINAGKFYGADILILGGDMTGKAIVPIIHQGGDSYKAILLEQESMLQGEDAVAEMEKNIKSRGYYPYRTTPEELGELNEEPERVDAIFHSEVLGTAEQWLAYADEKLEGTGIRCYVAPGNDDMFELDDLIRTSKYVQLAEGELVQLDRHHEMISSGWSNVTPWHTYREEGEEELRARYDAMINQLKNPRNSVFNLHVPPYGSTLDDVPELSEDLTPKHAGRSLVPVGSHAVRDVIKEHRPILGLHGHIHEGKGAIRVGKTLCINPGSMYEQGRLLGAVVKLARNKVKNYILTTG